MKCLYATYKTSDIRVAEVPSPTADGGSAVIHATHSLLADLAIPSDAVTGNLLAGITHKMRLLFNKFKMEGAAAVYRNLKGRALRWYPVGYSCIGSVMEDGKGEAPWHAGCRIVMRGGCAEYALALPGAAVRIGSEAPDDVALLAPLVAVVLKIADGVGVAGGGGVAVYGIDLLGFLIVRHLQRKGLPVQAVERDKRRYTRAMAAGLAPVGDARAAYHIVIRPDSAPAALLGDIADSHTAGVVIGLAVGSMGALFERQVGEAEIERALGLIATGAYSLPGIPHCRYSFDRYKDAVQEINNGNAYYAILEHSLLPVPRNSMVWRRPMAHGGNGIGIGLIGAGNYPFVTLLPLLATLPFRREGICSRNSLSAINAAQVFDFDFATTDIGMIINNPKIDAVIVATRHESHASIGHRMLEAGKHLFVEKPAALNRDELDMLIATASRSGRVCAVGFNRRFAPLVRKMRDEVTTRGPGPLSVSIKVNAGALPPGHWVLDAEKGGGRILSEGCHFLDLIVFLTGQKIESVTASYGSAGKAMDAFSITAKITGGGRGTIVFGTGDDVSFPTECITVTRGESRASVTDYRVLETQDGEVVRRVSLFKQDKGTQAMLECFFDAVAGRSTRIMALWETENVARAAIAAEESARRGGIEVLVG